MENKLLFFYVFMSICNPIYESRTGLAYITTLHTHTETHVARGPTNMYPYCTRTKIALQLCTVYGGGTVKSTPVILFVNSLVLKLATSASSRPNRARK